MFRTENRCAGETIKPLTRFGLVALVLGTEVEGGISLRSGPDTGTVCVFGFVA